VQGFCGVCHLVPPPDTFPRHAWRERVEHGYFFFYKAHMTMTAPPIEAVVKYYEDRAPLELPPAAVHRAGTPLPLKLDRLDFPGPTAAAPALISHISMVHLSDPRRPELLATDMGSGLVMTLRPQDDKPSWRILAKLKNPAHAEVVDLDGDGIKDILV